MRILIRFEDNYGCHTLFRYSKSILNHSEEHDIQVQEGLCDSVVFKIETSLIKLYKRYYDYSLKCPEHLYNIENFLENIKYEECLIRGLQSKSKWLTQKFHLKYSEQLLRVAFQKILKENDNGKIFIKHEDQLFKSINVLEDATNADAFAADIIKGIAQGVHNRRFHKFLTLEHIDELKEMVLTDYTLDLLCKELDDYHQSLQGIQKVICDYIDKKNEWMCGLSPQ